MLLSSVMVCEADWFQVSTKMCFEIVEQTFADTEGLVGCWVGCVVGGLVV